MVVCCFVAAGASAVADICAVCAQPILGRIYLYDDKLLQEKVYVCHQCSQLKDDCFACGLPVKSDSFHLSDGRFFCARDEKTAMLKADEALEICAEVKENLDRLFVRFTDFPTNLNLAMIDRVDLLAFKVPGNDYACPNILGYYYSRTNEGKIIHEISILSGLTLGGLKATCAHEYCHAWVHDNVPEARKEQLGRDAEEGFCELVSYLLMNAQHDEKQKEAILANAYTRGQIDFYVAAEKKFGFNDVLDWMKYGTERELTEKPEALHDIELPRAARPVVTNALLYTATVPALAGETLMLKGISWTKKQPLALINNQSFTAGESAKVRLGKTNVMIRCLAVRPDSVRVQIVDSGEERELALAHP